MNSEQFYNEVKKLRRLQRDSRRYYHDDKLRRECMKQEEIIDNEIIRVERVLTAKRNKSMFD